MRAKLNTLTRESVNFISLLNEIKIGLDIEISFFT